MLEATTKTGAVRPGGGSASFASEGGGYATPVKLAPESAPNSQPLQRETGETNWLLLVGRCVAGDDFAWTELVKAQHKWVYMLCYRFTGSAQDAEDLTQDVFARVYGSLASFDSSKGSFRGWLAALTRNILIDHFRRSRQQRLTDSLDMDWELPEERDWREPAADPRQSPQEAATRGEIAELVRAALARVSPELREAVILRDLQEMDYREIARVLRVPEGTVKSRISRGRAELARLLQRNKRQVI
jgi:RNA polymerase sigma-70 factor, ECF subfamily